MSRVTVVGSGFAALTAVRALAKAGGVQITLVSPKAEFQYLPGIIWIPSGLRRAEDLRLPLGDFFQRLGVHHLAAAATGLSADGRVLETSAGPVENDGLIIASGGRFLKKLPGIELAITPCEGIAAAERIKGTHGDSASTAREKAKAGSSQPTATQGAAGSSAAGCRSSVKRR